MRSRITRPFRRIAIVMLGIAAFAMPPSAAGQARRPPEVPGRPDSLAYWMQRIEEVHAADPRAGLGIGAQALRLLSERADPDAAMYVLFRLGEMHFALGSYDEAEALAEELYSRAVSRRDLLRQAEAKALRADVVVRRAWYFGREAEYGTGQSLAEDAHRRYVALADTVGISWTLRILARVFRLQGRFAEARRSAEEALALARAARHSESVALSLERLAAVYDGQGDSRRAISHSSQALAIADSLGDRVLQARILGALSVQHGSAGNLDSAIVRQRQELSIRSSFGDRAGSAWNLHDLGLLQQKSGDFEAATVSFRAALELWLELGSEWEVARNLDFLGRSLAVRAAELAAAGRYESAVEHYQEYGRTVEQLLAGDNAAKVVEMREQYGTWDRQKQILLLEQARRIQNFWLVSLIVGVGLVGCIAFLVYGRYRFSAAARRELAAAYDSLQGSHEELKRTRAEVDQMKARFFANISHEFRTPLTLILGQIDAVAERASGKDLERLDMAARNGQQLKGLINQLLDLSKLEAGEASLDRRPTEFVSLLKGVFYSFESLAARKQITLRVRNSHDRLVVAVDVEKIIQVFNNLCSNALKFTPDGGEIELRIDTASDPSEVVVAVRDTGIGIPADRIGRVFDRFFQVGSSSTRDYEGTGIGLALTKELVSLHGGTISVTSEQGRGSTFEVRLPFEPDLQLQSPAQSDPEPARALQADRGWTRREEERFAVSLAQNDPADPDTGLDRDAVPGPEEDDVQHEAPQSILIVEDSADVRSYLRDHLASSYRVTEACDGRQGIDLARELMPDLIITDVMMPRLDGYDLSRLLRDDARTSHIPIVMLTARAAQEDKLEGLQMGVDDYLEKPFSPKELLARVNNLIASRERLRRRYRTVTVIKPSEIEATSMDQAFLAQVVRQIEEHMGDSWFGADALAAEVHMSVSQLNRKLNALIGQTAGRLQRSIRLQRADDLLRQESGTVAEIAYAVGFVNASHFSTAFRKQYGRSPSESPS